MWCTCADLPMSCVWYTYKTVLLLNYPILKAVQKIWVFYFTQILNHLGVFGIYRLLGVVTFGCCGLAGVYNLCFGLRDIYIIYIINNILLGGMTCVHLERLKVV